MRIMPTLYWYLLGSMCLVSSALITHVVTCIKDDRILLLIGGAIAWPIGVAHGFGIWLGVWP